MSGRRIIIGRNFGRNFLGIFVLHLLCRTTHQNISPNSSQFITQCLVTTPVAEISKFHLRELLGRGGGAQSKFFRPCHRLLSHSTFSHEAWLLDANNPHIGAFRHAPRALAPSKHIRSSEALLWEHKLAARTVELLGPRRRDDGSSTATLSGATGHQLASELQRCNAREHQH